MTTYSRVADLGFIDDADSPLSEIHPEMDEDGGRKLAGDLAWTILTNDEEFAALIRDFPWEDADAKPERADPMLRLITIAGEIGWTVARLPLRPETKFGEAVAAAGALVGAEFVKEVADAA